jgi:hypothetical protein
MALSTPLYLASGSVSQPSLSFSATTNTGLYVTSGNIAVSVNGVNVNTFTSTGLKGGIGVSNIALLDNTDTAVFSINQSISGSLNAWSTSSTTAADGNALILGAWSPELGIFSALPATGVNAYTSADGNTWTATSGLPTSSATTQRMVWAPWLGQFVALGTSRSWRSSDGATWTSISTIASTQYAYDLAAAPELRMMVGVFTYDGFSGTFVAGSYEGASWTSIPPPAGIEGVSDWRCVAWSPDLHLWVALSYQYGLGGTLATSTDGIYWTPSDVLALSAATPWTACVWSPELYMFVTVSGFGGSTQFRYSSNGTTWLSGSGTVSTTAACYSLKWIPELGAFVGACSGGSAHLISYDGITWSTFSVSNMTSLSLVWAPTLKRLLMFTSTGPNKYVDIQNTVKLSRTNQGNVGLTARTLEASTATLNEAKINRVMIFKDLMLSSGANLQVFNGSLAVSKGSETAPSIVFSQSSGPYGTTGLYRTSISNHTGIGLSTNGILRCDWNMFRMAVSTPLHLASGTVSAPSLSFAGDTSQNTGLYWIGEDNMGLTTGGSLRCDWNATRMALTTPLFLSNGSATLPSLSFSGDTSQNSGMFLIANDNIGLSTGGTLRCDWNNSRMATSIPIHLPNGSAAAPAISFSSDGSQNTGFYAISDDNIGLTTGGTLRCDWNSSRMLVSSLLQTNQLKINSGKTISWMDFGQTNSVSIGAGGTGSFFVSFNFTAPTTSGLVINLSVNNASNPDRVLFGCNSIGTNGFMLYYVNTVSNTITSLQFGWQAMV